MKKIVVLVLSSIAVLTASLANVASAQRSETTIENCESGWLNNIAQITADSDVDVDSTPGNATVVPGVTEDDVAQDCTNVIALVDLELEKEISANKTLDIICTNGADNPRKSDDYCIGTSPNYTGGDPSKIFCNDVIEYTVTLSNQGPSAASADIVIEDYLPGELTGIATTVTGTDTATLASSTITWTVKSDLAAGASTTLKIEGEVGC